jgi:hypothetical protein
VHTELQRDIVEIIFTLCVGGYDFTDRSLFRQRAPTEIKGDIHQSSQRRRNRLQSQVYIDLHIVFEPVRWKSLRYLSSIPCPKIELLTHPGRPSDGSLLVSISVNLLLSHIPNQVHSRLGHYVVYERIYRLIPI